MKICPVCQSETKSFVAPLRQVCSKKDHEFVKYWKYDIFRLTINNSTICKSVQPLGYYFNSHSIPEFKLEDIYTNFLLYYNLKAFL